ncbi:hypothetical protein HNP55_003195 [Paucibacter oligotrophus]|uniref:Peptidase M14 domain-containing protein n=1 Tax=Roseateles oligotrophus TaxID=1769250 RepID=A0A840LA75_9BURK|nr:M14 family zinc carboxypeptidase [Roseateles oligotrophus]MBB4844651.1 hypothetical protein [Roseateles oligotrophus]
MQGLVLLDQSLPRSLDVLLDWARQARPSRLQAWVFEGQAARRAAEQALAALGIGAQIRSAYKPILHAFLEELGLERAGELQLHLPTPLAQRLRMETYPLAGLLRGARLSFVEDPDLAPDEVWPRWDGQDLPPIFVPLQASAAGASATAWLRAWQGDELLTDGPLPGDDYQAAAEAVFAAVAAHDWGASEPFFERLLIDIEIGGIEQDLDFGDELMSTREALHEELYFGLLEFFQQRSGRPAGDRLLRPGQIVPMIHAAEAGPTRVRVQIAPHPVLVQLPPQADAALLQGLADCAAPLTPEQSWAALEALAQQTAEVERFGLRSVQGRPVPGLYRRGSRPGVVISAGQHANECSGVVGALRGAAQLLQQHADAHLALLPLENPDGAALHQALCRQQPQHMHHAARFTALGDDLEVRQPPAPLFEKAARLEAIARCAAGLHLSLHGYPAHEWTRPLSGYLPPGYASWAIPRGFFLILRHHPGREPWPFLQALTAGLAEDQRLVDFNARQYRLWQAHWGELPMRVLNGIGCMVMEDSRSAVPYTLISEYPDETVYGEVFQLAHQTQMRAVLLACELYWRGVLAV